MVNPPCRLLQAACVQLSMGSEMGTVDLSHIASVTQREFKGADHGFSSGDTALFINSITADIAREADNQDFINSYIAIHKRDPVNSTCPWSPATASEICSDKSRHGLMRFHSRKVVPKHFWVNKEYATWGDSGMALLLCL